MLFTEEADYLFRKMRRFKQQISEEECRKVLRGQKRGVYDGEAG